MPFNQNFLRLHLWSKSCACARARARARARACARTCARACARARARARVCVCYKQVLIQQFPLRILIRKKRAFDINMFYTVGPKA